MSDISKLKQRRSGHKGAITVQLRDLENILESAERSELKALVETVKGQLSRIDKLNSDIYDQLTGDELAAELETEVKYEHKINISLAKVQLAQEQDRQERKDATYKLPKLALPYFSGDYTQWTGFYDVFESVIVKNKELTPVQKLSYLKGQLKGEAAELIKGFKIENNSYEAAIDLLQKTYGQEEKVKTAFIQRLLELVPPEHEVENLKSFYASFESTVRTLHNLKVTADEIVTVILLAKVPSPLKEILKRELKENPIDLQEFTHAYQMEVFSMDQGGRVEGAARSTASFTTPVSQQKNKASKSSKGCRLCSGDHFWFKCMKYKTNGQRIKRAQNLKLCTCCMQNHGGGKCTNENVRDCKHCGGRHYHLLCPREVEKSTTATCQVATVGKKVTILPTIELPVSSTKGGSRKLRVLVDQCSQRTFITRSTLDLVKYESCEQETLGLQGFTGTNAPKLYDVVKVFYTYHGATKSLTAVVVEDLPTHSVKGIVSPQLKNLRKKGIKLADSKLQGNGEIQMLIGADYYYSIVHPGYKREDDLILIPTIRGYMLSGTCQHKDGDTNVDVVTILKLAVQPLDKYVEPVSSNVPEPGELEGLWNLDNIGIVSRDLDYKSKQVLENFDKSITYDQVNHQYVVGLPWNDRKTLLKPNYGVALGRLRGLQRKFATDPTYMKVYQEVILDQERRGFIERIQENESNDQPVHYLSHHGVHKDSATTPVRVVFDCSARASNGISLNDCLESGPSLVPDLVKVLLRFRLQKYAFVSDIEKAFLMVQLQPEDRDAVRFLWPDHPEDINSPCRAYRFRVVLFGATCSQFLLNATILHHLDKMDLSEQVQATIKGGLYIDNLHGTSNSHQDLMDKYRIDKDLFQRANLYLREWYTNSTPLRRCVESEGLASKEVESVKVLGMRWNLASDQLTFSVGVIDRVTTKRQCLSLTAHLFDPLGILLPVTIRGRIGLQNLWRSKVGWDDTLSESDQLSWDALLQDYKDCSLFQLDRIATCKREVELHCFSDASQVAYGTVMYVVSDGQSRLLMAKAKVAPIKQITVPKLELTAVLLSARLLDFVKQAYRHCLTITGLYLWCDSQIALHWIHNDKPKHLYVTHRVDEIKDLASDALIRYVSTQDNPADALTRGLTASQLQQSTLWWEGPQWLTTKDKWPEELIYGEQVESPSATLVIQDTTQQIVEWTRYGTYQKAINVVAWVNRFISNLKLARQDQIRERSPVLSVKEIRFAELSVVQLVQKEGFPEQWKALHSSGRGGRDNLVRQLGLILDGDIIRCQGRLQCSELKDLAKTPILLPNKHHVTTLLIRYYHKLSSHYGVGHVLAYMRQTWWIPKMRQAIKRVQYQCVICKRLQGKPYVTPDNPPLPKMRVTAAEPFTNVGVDYTGAINVKSSGNDTKCYIVLFTCTTTRAIHLEVVSNLSSDSFIHAFRRFASRRGYPQVIWSDNATTFVGAASYLSQLQSDPKVHDLLREKGCEWKFIPARAPWFGAIWERLIGVLKAGLKKVLARALVSIEELLTVVTELEATINDRPLTYASGDKDDLEPITPSMLLYGRRLVTYPHLIDDDVESDPDYTERAGEMRVRLDYVTKIFNHLWKRWSSEYLTFLRQKVNNNTKSSWPKEGDVVLVHDGGPRLFWKMARVLEPIEGPDGVVRVVKINLAGHITTRPVVNLYPLEESAAQSAPRESGPSVSQEDISVSRPIQRPLRQAAARSTRGWRACIQDGSL